MRDPSFNRAFLTIIIIVLLVSSNVLAQQSTSTTSAVKTVTVTASAKEAEVGQEVKLTVVATDASGNVLKGTTFNLFCRTV